MVAGAVALVALLAAALWIPFRVRVSVVSTAFSGYGEMRISWLRLALRIPARLRLLGGKRPHMDILHVDGSVRKRIAFAGKRKPPSPWGKALRTALIIRRARATVWIGVRDAPATTALLCGAAESAGTAALHILLPDADVSLQAVPVFSQNALRLQFTGIARVRLGKLIRTRLRIRGE